LKLAISGKGGVGKSTVAATLAILMARQGQKVLAIDADPDANLASALGIPGSQQAEIIPIARQKALIEERTGAKIRQYGQMFKLNPEVSDIADKYAYMLNGVALLVLGAIESGGSGCACPESALLKTLVQDLILRKNETLVMDMEAGVEHLGRATARAVDTLLVVVEPGQRSIDCARRIFRMALDIGLKDVRVIANKIVTPEHEAFIRQSLPEREILGFIPYAPAMSGADRDGRSVLDGMDQDMLGRFANILKTLETKTAS